MVPRAILSNWKTVNSKPPTITIGIVACTFSDNLSFSVSSKVSLSPGGGGYSQEFLVGVCRPVLQILTLFQTKKCHFPNPFSDQASKLHTLFQTRAEIMSSLLRLEREQKNSSNPFRIRVFLFLPYSFGIEAINTFIRSLSSLENYIRFQTKGFEGVRTERKTGPPKRGTAN